MIKTIPEGKFQHIEFKPTVPRNSLYVKSPLGLILFDRNGFSIYSKTTNKLLYNLDVLLEEFQCSESSIIIEKPDLSYWIMTFKHSLIPKEEIKLIEEKSIIKCTFMTTGEFEYPFFALQETEENLKLFDVRTGQDLLKENNITVPKHPYKNFMLSKKYFVIRTDNTDYVSRFVFRTLNMKEKPYEIITNDDHRSFLSENILFIYYTLNDCFTVIECHHLDTQTVLKVNIPFTSIRSINESFIDSFDITSPIKIYEWNSSLTNLKLLIDLKCGNSLLNCFSKHLPFYVLSETEDIEPDLDFWDTTKRVPLFIRVYSKTKGNMLIEYKISEFVNIFTDGVSRIYYKHHDNNETKIGIIDFYC